MRKVKSVPKRKAFFRCHADSKKRRAGKSRAPPKPPSNHFVLFGIGSPWPTQIVFAPLARIFSTLRFISAPSS